MREPSLADDGHADRGKSGLDLGTEGKESKGVGFYKESGMRMSEHMVTAVGSITQTEPVGVSLVGGDREVSGSDGGP